MQRSWFPFPSVRNARITRILGETSTAAALASSRLGCYRNITYDGIRTLPKCVSTLFLNDWHPWMKDITSSFHQQILKTILYSRRRVTFIPQVKKCLQVTFSLAHTWLFDIFKAILLSILSTSAHIDRFLAYVHNDRSPSRSLHGARWKKFNITTCPHALESRLP